MSVDSINDIIENCKKNNSIYQDDETNQNLLNHLDLEMDSNRLDNIKYLRFECPLFKDGISTYDIHQGSLGNCYLLAALSVLSKQPQYISRLFYHKGIEYGIVGVWFFYQGGWKLEMIDTRIPCIDSLPIFAYTEDEYWVMLLEKAWAKLHKSYYNTIGGSTNDVLHYLTGNFSITYDLVNDNDVDEMYETGELWKTLIKQYNRGNFITTGGLKETLIDTLDGEMDPNEIDNSVGGLVDNHAYSILDVKIVEDNKLIRLYNPWGHFEWTGDWSDKDTTNWSENMKIKLDYIDDNDGSFWMNWNDFYQHFCYLYISYVQENHSMVKYGEWEKYKTCGGYDSNWFFNPHYSLDMDTNGKVSINMSQKDTRQKGGGNWLYIILDIIQNPDNSLKQTLRENNILKSVHINNRTKSIELDVDITKGKIWLVPSLWEEGKMGEYWLLLSSATTFYVNQYQESENNSMKVSNEDMNCLICRKTVDLIKDKYTYKQIKWHYPECFTCSHCYLPMNQEDTQFYDIKLNSNGEYGGYCKTCYNQLYSEKCLYCQEPIHLDESYYNKDGGKLHLECKEKYVIEHSPKCNYCYNPIYPIENKYSGQYYTINNNETIHQECYQDYLNSNAEQCLVCHTNILGQYYTSKQGKFHINCLNDYYIMISPTCYICGNKIIRQQYYTITGNNNKLYCHIHCYS